LETLYFRLFLDKARLTIQAEFIAVNVGVLRWW